MSHSICTLQIAVLVNTVKLALNGQHKDQLPLFPTWSLWRGLTASAKVFLSNPTNQTTWICEKSFLALKYWSYCIEQSRILKLNGVRIIKQIEKIVAPTHTLQSRKHTVQLSTYSHLQAQGMQPANVAERTNKSHKDSSIGTVLKICCTYTVSCIFGFKAI